MPRIKSIPRRIALASSAEDRARWSPEERERAFAQDASFVARLRGHCSPDPRDLATVRRCWSEQ